LRCGEKKVIGFLWAFIGAVFGAGCAWTALKLGLAKEREDRETAGKAESERREQEITKERENREAADKAERERREHEITKERENREAADKAERERREQEKALIRKDLDGLGGKIRGDEGRAERRWKHMIATQIETSQTLREAREHAKLLREDAWRD
jgi:hypothetical protein